MAAKPTKIVDIQAPKDVTAGASSRPLLVTNRPVLNDPMVKGEAAADEKARQPVARTAKTIKPLTAPDLASATPADDKAAPAAAEATTAEADKPATPDAANSDASAAPDADTPETLDKPSVEASAPETTEDNEPDFTRDAAAETKAAESKAEAARAARTEELEQLIASGKYFVPIDAVGRRRSRLYALLLTVCALLLAVALLDVALDAGLIKLPISLPHTHFF
jgi:anti-sigma28 factor (negative regulator of flagellin synthesis)